MHRDGLRKIVASTLDCEPLSLQEDTILANIENFDSVSILSLMVVLDDEVGVKLDHADLSKIIYYGDLESAVKSKGVILE